MLTKQKESKKCVIKRKVKFNNYNSLLKDEIISKSQQRFKSESHNLHTEEINKIALMLIKDYRLLIKLHHIHMVQMLEKYVKQKLLNPISNKKLLILKMK